MSTLTFLRFEQPTIDGDIEVLSWSHGFTQPTSASRGAGTVEQASHSNLTVTKYVDASTQEILRYCWSGKQIGKVTLTCLRDSAPYLKVVMEHVVIANYSVSSGPNDIAVENLAFDYGIVHYEYKDQTVRHDLESRTVQ